ncbi:MAG: hypothetical protein GY804_05700 [Alphaproteobacteria bacterium]|nr:hypothetical protein [Alphaproteobacteria bacterium]
MKCKKIIFMMFVATLSLMIGRSAFAVTHFVSGAIALMGTTEEESSITPDFIKSLFMEEQKLNFLGESEQELDGKLAEVKAALDKINKTIGSADFSPMTVVDEGNSLNGDALTTMENPAAMYGWLNNELVLPKSADHDNRAQNAKGQAILRNGSRTIQYSQALKMYYDIEARSNGLFQYAAFPASGDVVSYQSYLSSHEARIYELDADRLYLQTLGSIAADTEYMAGNNEIFKSNF